jgi:hypothetical protein
MARAYSETGLPEMIQNAEEALHKEQVLLWSLKELFIHFRGDQDWLPVGELSTDYDSWLLSSTKAEHTSENGHGTIPSPLWDGNNGQDEIAEQNGVEANGQKLPHTNGTLPAQVNGDSAAAEAPPTASRNPEDAADVDMEEPSPPHRMTTRALAAGSQRVSESPSVPQHPLIHPFFLPPDSIQGQPEPSNPEEDPLVPLLSYISKQEEIVRLSKELYQGLLKGLRMRSNVFRWCKAEGHIGEMSDGEDWVDLEEWGLEEGQLVKGKDEEENDNVHEGPARRGRRGGRGAADR